MRKIAKMAKFLAKKPTFGPVFRDAKTPYLEPFFALFGQMARNFLKKFFKKLFL